MSNHTYMQDKYCGLRYSPYSKPIHKGVAPREQNMTYSLKPCRTSRTNKYVQFKHMSRHDNNTSFSMCCKMSCRENKQWLTIQHKCRTARTKCYLHAWRGRWERIPAMWHRQMYDKAQAFKMSTLGPWPANAHLKQKNLRNNIDLRIRRLSRIVSHVDRPGTIVKPRCTSTGGPSVDHVVRCRGHFPRPMEQAHTAHRMCSSSQHMLYASSS